MTTRAPAVLTKKSNQSDWKWRYLSFCVFFCLVKTLRLKVRWRFWSWTLLKIMRLMFCQCFEAEFWYLVLWLNDLWVVYLVKALNPLARCAFGNVCFNVCSCPQKPDQLQTEGQENKIMKGHTFGKEKAEGEIIHKITMTDREIWSQDLHSFVIFNLRRM